MKNLNLLLIFKRNKTILISFCILFFALLFWISIDASLNDGLDPNKSLTYDKLFWLESFSVALVNVVFFPIIVNFLMKDFHFSKKLLCIKKMKRNLLLTIPFFVWSFLIVLLINLVSMILQKSYISFSWKLTIFQLYLNIIFIFSTLLIGFLILSFVKNTKKLMFISLILLVFLTIGPGSMLFPSFTLSNWFPYNEIRRSFMFLGTSQINSLNWLVSNIENFDNVFFKTSQEIIDKNSDSLSILRHQELYKTIKFEIILTLILLHFQAVILLLLIWKMDVLTIKENKLFINSKGTKAWNKL